MGVSLPSVSDFSHNSHRPDRLAKNANLWPSREMLVSQASIPGDVTALPAPVIRPRLASNGNIQPCTRLDSLANAILFPSGEAEKSVCRSVPVVNRSIATALRVCGSTRIRQIFLAPRNVRSK